MVGGSLIANKRINNCIAWFFVLFQTNGRIWEQHGVLFDRGKRKQLKIWFMLIPLPGAKKIKSCNQKKEKDCGHLSERHVWIVIGYGIFNWSGRCDHQEFVRALSSIDDLAVSRLLSYFLVTVNLAQGQQSWRFTEKNIRLVRMSTISWLEWLLNNKQGRQLRDDEEKLKTLACKSSRPS